MTNPVTPQDYAALLESLRVTDDGPSEMYGWRFDTPFQILRADIERNPEFSGSGWKLVDYLLERLYRAEANGKPATLLEDVKACMRYALDIGRQCERDTCSCPIDIEGTCYDNEFRKLSEAGDK